MGRANCPFNTSSEVDGKGMECGKWCALYCDMENECSIKLVAIQLVKIEEAMER